jgi:hypothetical protein
VITLAAGVFGDLRMPKAKDPVVDIRTYVVSCAWPGASLATELGGSRGWRQQRTLRPRLPGCEKRSTVPEATRRVCKSWAR